jgi:hypothetical protein
MCHSGEVGAECVRLGGAIAWGDTRDRVHRCDVGAEDTEGSLNSAVERLVDFAKYASATLFPPLFLVVGETCTRNYTNLNLSEKISPQISLAHIF